MYNGNDGLCKASQNIDSKKKLAFKARFHNSMNRPYPMKKYTVVIRHSDYIEKYATTNDFKTAVLYALEAFHENKGKVIKIIQ